MEEFSAKKLRKASNRAGMMMIVFTVLVLVASALARMLFPLVLNEDSPNYDTITVLILFLLQFVVVIPLTMAVFRLTPLGKGVQSFKPLFCKPKQPLLPILRWIVIIVGLSYAANMAANLVMSMIKLLTGFEINNLTIESDNTLLSMASTSLAVMILAPVFEESFFRLDILSDMKRYGTWSVMLFSGIMFGMLHSNFQQIGLAFVLGTGSAFLVIKTGSIYPSFLVHFCLNTISNAAGLISGIMNSGEGLDQERLSSGDTEYIMANIIPVLGAICIVMLVFGLIGVAVMLLVFEIVARRNTFKLEKPFPEVGEVKKFLICFSAPCTIIALFLFMVMTVLNAMGI